MTHRTPARRRRMTEAAAVSVALLALTSCGTRVDSPGTPVGLPTSTTAPGDVPTATPGDTGPGTAPGTGGDAGSAPTDIGGGGLPTSGSGSAPTVGGAIGRPAKSTPIRVGVTIPEGNAGAVLGVDVTDTPPEQAEDEVRALAAQINARGGFGGHPIQLFFTRMNKTDESEGTYTRIQNENCIKLTEDDKVHFVINFAYTNYSYQCYAKHRVPLFGGTGISLQDWHRLAPWLMPGLGVAMARMSRLMPAEWQRSGFLTQKMGIIAFDRSPERQYTTQYLKPGIESRGGKVLAVRYIDLNYDAIAAQTASAVLEYKGLGIDRVVFLAPGGGEWLVFSQQAESQNYRPRYGISSLDGPNTLSSAFNENQKVGATGPGVLPAVDVAPSERPPTSAQAKACWRYLNEKTGSSYQSQDTPGLLALARCELMYTAEAGWRAMTGAPMDLTKVRDSFFAIGTSYNPILFGPAHFRPGQPDSGSMYRTIVYDAARRLFTYSGPYRKITV